MRAGALFAVLLHIFRSLRLFNFDGCGFTYYDLHLTSTLSSILPPKMHETRRLLEAATALSLLLRNASIPHAFYGSVVTAVLATSPFSDASIPSIPLPVIFQLFFFFFRLTTGDFLYCRRWPEPSSPFPQNPGRSRRERRLHHHPFSLDKPVGFTPAVHFNPFLISRRLHVTYRRLIPAIEVRSAL